REPSGTALVRAWFMGTRKGQAVDLAPLSCNIVGLMSIVVPPPPPVSRRAAGRSARKERAPLAVPAAFARSKCGSCIALCCRYLALEVDRPTTPRDFDDLRW